MLLSLDFPRDGEVLEPFGNPGETVTLRWTQGHVEWRVGGSHRSWWGQSNHDKNIRGWSL